MEFTVSPEVFDRFPGMHLAVAIAHHVDNRVDRPPIAEWWRETWRQAAVGARAYGNAQSHPRVQPWRERFRLMGISGKEFPSSIEALLRRALRGGEPFQINPLVDFYNAVSLKHVVPAGGFDLRTLERPLELRVTREGDHFTAPDADAPEPVSPGEVAYADGVRILTRHFVWRQARTGLITRDTSDVFLISEILGELGGEAAQAVLDEFQRGLRGFFGVSASGVLLDEGHSTVSW